MSRQNKSRTAPFLTLIACANEAAVTDLGNYTNNKTTTIGLSGEWSANQPRQLRDDAFHVKTSQSVESLWRRASARNVSFWISLRWPIQIINSVDKTKLSCEKLAQSCKKLPWSQRFFLFFIVLVGAAREPGEHKSRSSLMRWNIKKNLWDQGSKKWKSAKNRYAPFLHEGLQMYKQQCTKFIQNKKQKQS